MNSKRVFTLSTVLASAVFLAFVSWWLGLRIQSPAEAAARTAPPVPSPILVPVEFRSLSATVITRGTARFDAPSTLSLPISPLKGEAGRITMLPTVGTQVEEGDILLTASGRPLFVFSGSTPAYRDMVIGTQGDDVRQLEMALQRLGMMPGAVDGVFDNESSAAVARLFNAAGFSPLSVTVSEQNQLSELELRLSEAQRALTIAQNEATLAPLALELARAIAAQEQLEIDAMLANATAVNQSSVEALVRIREMSNQLAIEQAAHDQIAAEEALLIAEAQVDALTDQLDTARALSTSRLALDEFIFVPELPVRVANLEVAVGDDAVGALLQVTNNRLVIDASLPLAEVQLIEVGMPVTIDEPSLGVSASGRISRVATAPGTDGVDGFHVYFETEVQKSDIVLEGFSLRLTIPVESTNGSALVVPVAALSLAADGRSRVQVSQEGGLAFVTVSVGLSADGWVEVTPLDGELSEGQLVVIGFE